MISVIITMTLIWLLLCFASVVTLKQYAQKNLELTGATMSHSLEASLVFNDSLAANETLAALGKQGQFAVAEVINAHKKRFAYWSWNPEDNNDTLGALVSRWLFPVPVAQPIMHNGATIGEIRLTARDSLIGHFIWMSFAVLTGCILFATVVALTITQSLHHGMVTALQNITDVVHDVRTNRNFSRRVKDGRIEEFHQFGEDFNSLLDEMEEWQLKLQAKNAQLLRTAMHDPLTGLANRAAFRNSIAALMNDPSAKTNSALLFLDGDNFKFINDTWGHAAGDCVLIEVASRMMDLATNVTRHTALAVTNLPWCCTAYTLSSRFNTFVLRYRSSLSVRLIFITDKKHRCHSALALLWRGKMLPWKHYWRGLTATCIR